MSELIRMSSEEVSALLSDIESLLQQWDEDLSLLHTIGSALHQFWEAPAAMDYIYEVHHILREMEREVEKLRFNHRLASKEYEEWVSADVLPITCGSLKNSGDYPGQGSEYLNNGSTVTIAAWTR